MKTIEKVRRMVAKTEVSVKKHSPAILMVAGVTCFAGAMYTAYKAGPKVEKIVEEVEKTRELEEDVNKFAVAKDLAKVLYLPILLGAAGTTAVVFSYRIQSNRIFTLAGALATTMKAKQAFEERVKDHLGEEAYNQFISENAVESSEEDEQGNKIDKITVIKNEIDSTFGEWYKNSSEYLSDDHGYNMAWIDSCEASLDLKLFGRGTLLLNEVRDKLGFPRIRAGALLGWTSADFFKIDKIVTNFEDPKTGEFKTEILVKWTQPHYIYDEVEFGPTFDTW